MMRATAREFVRELLRDSREPFSIMSMNSLNSQRYSSGSQGTVMSCFAGPLDRPEVGAPLWMSSTWRVIWIWSNEMIPLSQEISVRSLESAILE